MRRTITGFHRDDAGDWVAELSCLHRQHVRHRPPFQDRAWVLQQAGRDQRIGADLDCPLCDRAEPPSDLVAVRTAGPFDEKSLPPGLRRAHQVAAGTWGRLRITGGAVDFTMAVDPQISERMEAGTARWLPPEISHALAIDGPVSLEIDFFTRAQAVLDDGAPERMQEPTLTPSWCYERSKQASLLSLAAPQDFR